MARHRPRTLQLRNVIDGMPVQMREAMLEGVRENQIVTGAYSDRDGGVCPLVAAHRCGARANYPVFVRAWDRFTGAAAARRDGARRATRHELRVLESQLEASLLAEDDLPELAEAISEHRTLVGRRLAQRPPAGRRQHARPGDPDRSRELAGSQGWSWLRPFRRLDDYERAMALVRAELPAGNEAPDRPAAAKRHGQLV